MDKTTRSELVQTVETQRGQIEKYQIKLRDLIAAYKSVVKEKEALEASVHALSAAHRAPPTTEADSTQLPTGDDTNSSFSDPLREIKDDPHDESVQMIHLRQQLATLTTSLGTLSQEKSKMEANFLAEKKALKQEHEEVVERLRRELDRNQRLVSDLRGEVAEWRAQVLVLQHERERSQQDHSMRTRELQKVLSQERASRDGLENQIDDMKQIIAEISQATPRLSERYEDRIKGLSEELEAVRKRLKNSEEHAMQPSPLLLKLQEEMAEIKAQHRIAVQREQARANDAERQLAWQDEQGEARVSGLEAKLSELSGVVGNYERLRFQDQDAIHKLRERVTQLDMENTALARAAHKGMSGEEDDTRDDSNLDVQAIVDKIIRLKGRLKMANEGSEKPVDIEELLRTGELSHLVTEDLHKHCSEDYDHLKEEFERYKLRAQSVLKNKSMKDTGSVSKETAHLKSQLADLKERMRYLLDDQDETEREHRRASDDLRRTMTALQERHQVELTARRAEYESRQAELELEIRRHRDRTIALLAEKDKELETLRARLPNCYQGRYMAAFRGVTSQSSVDSDDATPFEQQASQSLVEHDSTVVSELIKRTSLGGGGGASAFGGGVISGGSGGGVSSSGMETTSLLHFAQEQARKDVEINMLRKQKHSLESALRDLQRTHAAHDEAHGDALEAMEDQVRRLQRMTSREDAANLEYLKNVIYQYMVCQDATGKASMLNAISTILQFSPREKQRVRHLLSSGWWGASSASYTSSPRTGPNTRI